MQTYGLLADHVSLLLGGKSQTRAAQTVIMRPVAHQPAAEILWSYSSKQPQSTEDKSEVLHKWDM